MIFIVHQSCVYADFKQEEFKALYVEGHNLDLICFETGMGRCFQSIYYVIHEALLQIQYLIILETRKLFQ